MSKVFLPSLVSCLIPVLLLQTRLKGKLSRPQDVSEPDGPTKRFRLSPLESRLVFCIGVGGLVLIPSFRYLTGLPPFMGILLVFALLWVLTEVILRGAARRHLAADEDMEYVRVSHVLHSIDLSTILFFLGILMTVAAIQPRIVIRKQPYN